MGRVTGASAPSGDGLRGRQAALEARLRALPSLVVAYSGGVDSAYLAWVASRILGADALCVTADSPSYPERHRAMALAVAEQVGLRHEIIRTDEMSHPGYRANTTERCYHCKHELHAKLTALAQARGFAAVADGSNADDRGDYRPGRRAAREFGVISPLDEANLTKLDIRALSRDAGLPTWDEPASPCLSSRIPYFSEVTEDKLQTIARAEEAVRGLGFRVVRVRHHGELARLEIGADEMARAVEPDTYAAIDRALRELGFLEVTLDRKGYRQGSLNEGLSLRPV
jgi:uncharacterized protein